MENKKNKKKFSLAFKKEVALKAVSNKRKLEESKPADVWNAKKRKWTKPSSQIGYKALTVRGIFVDMKDEVSTVLALTIKVVSNLLGDVKSSLLQNNLI